MPPLQAHKDHCQTAEDVLSAARAAVYRRKEWRVPRVVNKQPTVNPQIEPDVAKPEPVEMATPEPIEIKPITIRDIQVEVCRIFNVALIDILSERKSREVTIPRQLCMVLARVLTLHSLPAIGRHMGGRDHTTVYHAIKKYQWMTDELRSEFTDSTPLPKWVLRAHELLLLHR